jgi:hypothetical protein
MDILTVPGPVREKLGDAGSDGLISTFRVAMLQQMSALRADVLKWSFLFWIGQLTATVAVLSFLLRNVR